MISCHVGFLITSAAMAAAIGLMISLGSCLPFMYLLIISITISAFSELLYELGPNRTIAKDLAEVVAEYAYRSVLYRSYYYDQRVPTLKEFIEMCNEKRMETCLRDSTTNAFTKSIVPKIYMQYAPLLR